MAEFISAVSLLLALIGAVYSVWYPEISRARSVNIPRHVVDAAEEREEVRHALWARAIPLTLAAAVLTVIMLPEAIEVMFETIEVLRARPVNIIGRYDPVRAIVLFVTGLAAGFTVHLVDNVRRLRCLLRRLSPDKKSSTS